MKKKKRTKSEHRRALTDNKKKTKKVRAYVDEVKNVQCTRELARTAEKWRPNYKLFLQRPRRRGERVKNARSNLSPLPPGLVSTAELDPATIIRRQ